MKLYSRVIGILVFSASLGAQTPPPPAQARRPRPRPTSIDITVRDQTGAPIPFARVSVSGTVERSAMTNQDGLVTLQAMPDGTHRLRFEREGFVTLERDLTTRNGQPHELEITMAGVAAPPPPAPVPSQAEPPSAPIAPAAPAGPPVTLSIPTFLDKNFIGREPLKESVIGCTGSATTRLLQLRDPIAMHTHDLDEIIYVVAGDGAVRTRAANAQGHAEAARTGANPAAEPHDESTIVSAGSLSIVPRGIAHAIERRGRNPLIVLSTLAGAPCQTPSTTQQPNKQ